MVCLFERPVWAVPSLTKAARPPRSGAGCRFLRSPRTNRAPSRTSRLLTSRGSSQQTTLPCCGVKRGWGRTCGQGSSRPSGETSRSTTTPPLTSPRRANGSSPGGSWSHARRWSIRPTCVLRCIMRDPPLLACAHLTQVLFQAFAEMLELPRCARRRCPYAPQPSPLLEASPRSHVPFLNLPRAATRSSATGRSDPAERCVSCATPGASPQRRRTSETSESQPTQTLRRGRGNSSHQHTPEPSHAGPISTSRRRPPLRRYPEPLCAAAFPHASDFCDFAGVHAPAPGRAGAAAADGRGRLVGRPGSRSRCALRFAMCFTGIRSLMISCSWVHDMCGRKLCLVIDPACVSQQTNAP